MKRLVPLGLASLASLALMAPGAATAADVALVIGNHDYQEAQDAVSAKADARAVADALEQHGYRVTSGTDLDRDEMRRRIAEFAGRLDDDGTDRVVVFYSGHALRSGGVTYLAPVDQGNASLVEVMMDGVPLELVLRLAGQEPGQAVVFIDGAQLDGFTPKAFAEPGLAEIEAPEGVLVVSAAAPGRAIPRRSTGQSAFGRQVVEAFLAPGVSVSSADLASAEAALGLTRTDRLSIEQRLDFLGFAPGAQDRSFDGDTRWAIEGYQHSRGHSATGNLDRPTVAAVMQETRDADTGVVTGADVVINILRDLGQ